MKGEGDGLVDHRESHEVQEDDGTHRAHRIEGIVVAVHVSRYVGCGGICGYRPFFRWFCLGGNI